MAAEVMAAEVMAAEAGERGLVSLALVTVHVIAAITFVGPLTLATSLFPRYARSASGDPQHPAAAVAATMAQVSQRYSRAAIAVPVLGLAAALATDSLGEPWVMAAIGVTGAATYALVATVLPMQRLVLGQLAASGSEQSPSRPSMTDSGENDGVRGLAVWTGVFNLLWVAAVVLMVVQPGATTHGQ